MKKIIPSVSAIIASILFTISCEHEEVTPLSVQSNTKNISRVIFDGISVQDTLKVHYENKRVDSITWCTHVSGDLNCTAGYSETRYYNVSGELEFLNGRWKVFYFYEGEHRKKMMTYEGDQFFSSTNFEYSDNLPSRMKVYFAGTDLNEATLVDFTFNSDGDLTRKIITDKEGTLLADLRIVYSELENPLQGKIETIPYAVEYFDFDQFVFYYSKHIPLTITNTASAVPGHPVPHHVIRYALVQDESGRLVTARAFYNDIIVHNIQISYAID